MDPSPDGLSPRGVIVKALGRILVVGVVDFILLGLWAPNLVNMHRDLALAGAIGCLGLALAATGWLLVALWRDFALFNRLRRYRALAPWALED
jgi:hypothetical protein